ncbi:hypothetical protein [Flavobacterium sp. HJJ]|uniref:hypothetical protein n=1 Tax=Flavobacterium sp. HJJ TaxID=2783792 RepID=UPI00188A196C|nr:hypothetical protein [Flavobacterium sp. HJJ]MBF4471034.1 hypothetical protein [Flavobacterium sp. HJJ]
MKFLVTIFFMLSIIPVHSQELDKLYYILGYNWDYSIPRTYRGDLKSSIMGFQMHESHMGDVYRFSEVAGFKFKKRKRERDCDNCHQFYKFIDIPDFYKLGDFYDFTSSTNKETYYSVLEIEVKRQQGFFKPSVLENVTQLQMKSFLAGAYLEAGAIKGDTIKFTFHQAQNQRLTVIKDFINSIEKPKYLNVIHRQDEQDDCCGPTLLLLPNKRLMDLFTYEEERKNALVASHNLSKK